jgi:hypothetical protein
MHVFSVLKFCKNETYFLYFFGFYDNFNCYNYVQYFFKIVIYLFQQNKLAAAQCDSLGVNLYHDLGCIPHYDECNFCPIKYTCQGLGPWDKYCHFRGQTYANTEIVEDSLSSPSCDKACFCSISERFDT